MKVSNRRINKAKKKLAAGRPLKPTEWRILHTGNARLLVGRARSKAMVTAAMIAAQSAVRVAIIGASPYPAFMPAVARIAMKTIKVIEATQEAAQALSKSFQQLTEEVNQIRNEGKIQKR